MGKRERRRRGRESRERRREGIWGVSVLPTTASVFGEPVSLWGGEAGWQSWRDWVPQRGARGAERGGRDVGKGSFRGLPGMGVAARLSAPRALVLWAALGAAGKAQ